MKKRIINSSTIEVLITKKDLKEHGITFLDLLGNHHQIKEFFYNILNDVDTEHRFSNHESLIFKVLPNKNGLTLIISKDDSKFQSFNHNQAPSVKLPKKTTKPLDKQHYHDYLIRLDNFEDFVRISHVLKLINGFSNLYLYKNKYYLELYFNVSPDSIMLNQIKDQLSIAYEYGNTTQLTPVRLMKMGKKLISQKALEIGRRYFK